MVVDHPHSVHMVGEGLRHDVGERGRSVACHGSGLEFTAFTLGGVDGGSHPEPLRHDRFAVETQDWQR